MKSISVLRLNENAGLGSIVDSIAEQSSATAVVMKDCNPADSSYVRRNGITHQFSQFAPAMLQPEIRCYIESPSVINPLSMIAEHDSLERKGVEAFRRTFISGSCQICTPYHTAFARMASRTSDEECDWTGYKTVSQISSVLQAKDILFGGKRLLNAIASIRSELLEKYGEMKDSSAATVEASDFNMMVAEPEALFQAFEKFKKLATILHGDYITEKIHDERLVISSNHAMLGSVALIGVTRTFEFTRKNINKTLADLIQDDDNLGLSNKNRYLGAPGADFLNLDNLKDVPQELALTFCDRFKSYSDWKFMRNGLECSVPSKEAIKYIESELGVQVSIESHGKLPIDKIYRRDFKY